MNIQEVFSYTETNGVLAGSPDVVVLDSLTFHPQGRKYCHVMTLSDDIAERVTRELGWNEITRENGHIALVAQEKRADEVILALEALVMQQVGFFWHVHHGVLLGWCYGYDQRKGYILDQKSPDEQKLRLRLFQPVKGQLPQEVVEAWNAYKEAVRNTPYAAQSERGGIESSRNEAGNAYYRALSNHKDEIDALHEQECLDCPWDGETIFSAA